MKRIWRQVVCFFLGHVSSLFPGIGAPMRLQWAFPDRTKPQVQHQVPSMGSGILAGGFIHGLPSIQGPAYDLDRCQRCYALFLKVEPAACKHCALEKRLHDRGFCRKDCLNCGKPYDAHFDKKCPFEASNYRGTEFEMLQSPT